LAVGLVTAIPGTGKNATVKLPADQLLMFSAKRGGALAISLVGKMPADVEARLGKPSQVDGLRWVYNGEHGVVRVYFGES
jgi:hypothetical protein